MANGLDFVVIGFQKCGTASLRRWLRGHREVAVPEGELSPFLASPPFSKPGNPRTTWGEYLNAIADQPDGLRGAVDPTYGLCDVDLNAQSLAKNAGATPLKIVTVERHPVVRAYSAWQMASTAGWEDRSFEEAMASCKFDGPSWSEEKWLTQSYIESGEYDRITDAYRDVGFEVLRLKMGSPELPVLLGRFLGIDALGPGPMPHINRTNYPDSPDLLTIMAVDSCFGPWWGAEGEVGSELQR